MNAAEERSQNWYRVKHNPQYDMGYGDRLFYFEPGCEYGQEDHLAPGTKWYRLNCSYWFGDWIEENGKEEQWFIYGAPHRAIYIVREDLMTFIKMKWL